MKNIRKSFLTVLALASCLTMSACGEEPAPAVDPTSVGPTFVGTTLPDLIEVKPSDKEFEGITVNYNKIVLFEGETAQIEVECYPVRATKPAYKYVSSDTNLATVDANGVVTALEPYQKDSGEYVTSCTITVKTPDDKIEKVIPVSVYKENVKSNKINTHIREIRTTQSNNDAAGNGISKIKLEETIYSANYKDGVTTSYLKENQNMTISIEDAYFQLEAIDVQSKVAGGTLGTSKIKYTFYTNESFDTWVFREQGSVRNCMKISTTSFVGVENGRYKALMAVLDNFFTSGSEIMTKQINSVLGTEALNDAVNGKNIASYESGQFVFNALQNFKNQKSSPKYEENLGIPADALFDFDFNGRYEFINSYVASENEYRKFDWNYQGNSYSMVESVECKYSISGFELEYPNKDGFAIVEDIYSL